MKKEFTIKLLKIILITTFINYSIAKLTKSDQFDNAKNLSNYRSDSIVELSSEINSSFLKNERNLQTYQYNDDDFDDDVKTAFRVAYVIWIIFCVIEVINVIVIFVLCCNGTLKNEDCMWVTLVYCFVPLVAFIVVLAVIKCCPPKRQVMTIVVQGQGQGVVYNQSQVPNNFVNNPYGNVSNNNNNNINMNPQYNNNNNPNYNRNDDPNFNADFNSMNNLNLNNVNNPYNVDNRKIETKTKDVELTNMKAPGEY